METRNANRNYSVTDGTDFWEFIIDWQSTDFYRYNPIDDESQTMQYREYCAKRRSGEIPPTDKVLELHNIQHPIHVMHDGA
jgi:hypothetical protein